MKKTTKETNGTSFFNSTFSASVRELIDLLGTPDYECNDGSDKVNFVWDMETDNGNVFTVYDWKEYRPLSMDEKIEWHIGGFDKYQTILANDEIINSLNLTPKN